MKYLQLLNENNWVELKPVILTQEESVLECSFEDYEMSDKQVLMERIKSEREAIPDESDALLAQSAYDSIKPVLNEDDTYHLIVANFTINDGIVKGILNCKVNNIYQQIRL